MRVMQRMSAVILLGAMCSGTAMAVDADATLKTTQGSVAASLDKKSGAASVMGDKEGCPVSKGDLHKAGEPCPYMKKEAKMQDGCDMHDKKQVSKRHDAVDAEKMAAKPEK